jgi:hypothetical protein
MTYQNPNMGGIRPQYPGGNMPQMNQPNFQGYPGMQQAGNPYMNRPPQYPGNPGQMGFGGPGGYPGNMPGMPNPYQNRQQQQFQPQFQPQQQRNGRRPGLMSKLGNQQAAGMPPQGFNQYPQMGPNQQAGRRGLNLGRRQGGGGVPSQPMFQQPQAAPPGVSPMGKQIKPKQFTLSAVGNASGGSGVATIPDGNNLSLIANNLPDPASIAQGQNLSYVAFLTNRKGQGAFPVGQLMPIGGGTYRLNFNSNVPFYDYDQVLVSLENPYAIQNRPTGQVVLASTGGAGLSLPKPVRNFMGGVWSKVKGAGKGIGNRISGIKKPKEEPLPEPSANFQNLFNNYTLGPSIAPPLGTNPELPGLGSPTEAPLLGGNP